MKFRTEVPLSDQLRGLVRHGEPVWTVGSCFSDEMGRRLGDDLFEVEANPFGPLYNPVSVAEALLNVASRRRYTRADLMERDGVWHCWDFHSRFSSSQPEKVISAANSAIGRLHEQLPRLKTLILTLGTTRLFRLRSTGRVVANCHKFPSAMFAVEQDNDPASWVAPLAGALSRLREAAGRDFKVVLTVSPVRYSSFSLQNSSLSKASLLLGCNRLCNDPGMNAVYFPSYEIMNDELRDYRFYAADMLHPSEVACDYIFERFADAFFTPETLQLAGECRKVALLCRHRVMSDRPGAAEALRTQIASALTSLSAAHPELSRALSKLPS